MKHLLLILLAIVLPLATLLAEDDKDQIRFYNWGAFGEIANNSEAKKELNGATRKAGGAYCRIGYDYDKSTPGSVPAGWWVQCWAMVAGLRICHMS